MPTKSFTCPTCGEQHKSFYNAQQHEKNCTPAAQQETVKQYILRIS